MVPDVRLEIDDRKDITVAVDNNQQVVSSLVVVNTDEESHR